MKSTETPSRNSTGSGLLPTEFGEPLNLVNLDRANRLIRLLKNQLSRWIIERIEDQGHTTQPDIIVTYNRSRQQVNPQFIALVNAGVLIAVEGEHWPNLYSFNEEWLEIKAEIEALSVHV